MRHEEDCSELHHQLFQKSQIQSDAVSTGLSVSGFATPDDDAEPERQRSLTPGKTTG